MWYLAWLWTSSDWQYRPFSSFWALKMVGFLGKLLGLQSKFYRCFSVGNLGWYCIGASCCARKKRRKLKVRFLQQNDLLWMKFWAQHFDTFRLIWNVLHAFLQCPLEQQLEHHEKGFVLIRDCFRRSPWLHSDTDAQNTSAEAYGKRAPWDGQGVRWSLGEVCLICTTQISYHHAYSQITSRRDDVRWEACQEIGSGKLQFRIFSQKRRSKIMRYASKMILPETRCPEGRFHFATSHHDVATAEGEGSFCCHFLHEKAMLFSSQRLTALLFQRSKGSWLNGSKTNRSLEIRWSLFASLELIDSTPHPMILRNLGNADEIQACTQCTF